MNAHFCGILGKGIKACPRKNGVPIPQETILGYIRDQEQADEQEYRRVNHPLAKKTSRGISPPPPDIVVESHPFTVTPQIQNEQPVQKRQKGPLEKAFQNESRDFADRKITRCIYANGLAFNLVRSPYWKEMVIAINEAPKGYKSPGFEKVHDTLLEKKVRMVEDSLQPIKDSCVEIGMSISKLYF